MASLRPAWVICSKTVPENWSDARWGGPHLKSLHLRMLRQESLSQWINKQKYSTETEETGSPGKALVQAWELEFESLETTRKPGGHDVSRDRIPKASSGFNWEILPQWLWWRPIEEESWHPPQVLTHAHTHTRTQEIRQKPKLLLNTYLRACFFFPLFYHSGPSTTV